jgi:hypothetical protein
MACAAVRCLPGPMAVNLRTRSRSCRSFSDSGSVLRVRRACCVVIFLFYADEDVSFLSPVWFGRRRE